MGRTIATLVAVLAVGCGAGAPGESFSDDPNRSMLGDDLDFEPEPSRAAGEIERVGEIPFEPPAPALPDGPCVYVEPDALGRWPAAPTFAVEAIGRWGLDYVVGGPDCTVVIGLNPRIRWGKTELRDGQAFIGLNPEAAIVDSVECDDEGEWSEREIRFGDVVTHEFGHVLGLPEAEPGERGCAMCATPHCVGVFPTPQEKSLIAAPG